MSISADSGEYIQIQSFLWITAFCSLYRLRFLGLILGSCVMWEPLVQQLWMKCHCSFNILHIITLVFWEADGKEMLGFY